MAFSDKINSTGSKYDEYFDLSNYEQTAGDIIFQPYGGMNLQANSTNGQVCLAANQVTDGYTLNKDIICSVDV